MNNEDIVLIEDVFEADEDYSIEEFLQRLKIVKDTKDINNEYDLYILPRSGYVASNCDCNGISCDDLFVEGGGIDLVLKRKNK